MKVLYSLFVFTLIFTSCKQVSGNQNAAATPNLQPGSCNIGKWNNAALPLNLKISQELIDDFNNTNIGGQNPIEQMAAVWNNALLPNTTNLFKIPLETASGTGSATLSGFRNSEFGIYKSQTWFGNVSNNALAITQFYGIVRADAGLGTYIDLTHADIILNYNNFGSTFTYNGNSLFDYDVPTIILHEMGHFLGLCHENTYTSVMAPYYVTTQRSLKTFDTNKIKALYLNNQNYGISAFSAPNALSAPIGSAVKGVVELNANGICKHYINGKLVHQHIQQ